MGDKVGWDRYYYTSVFNADSSTLTDGNDDGDTYTGGWENRENNGEVFPAICIGLSLIMAAR